MPVSALIRLARRIFRVPVTQPISKPAFKPTLEALDLRAMPALFTWTDATGDNQYSDPYNWGDTAGVLSIPGPGDDILFPNFAGANGPGGQSGGATGASGPSGGSADCYGMQSSSGGPFNSITLTAGYTGTVTVTGPVQTDALYLNNGTIDQPAGSGSDMTVLGGATTNDYTWWLNPGWNGGSDFYWTGGTLNSTSNLANINISGSSTIATIAPANAGTVTTGDTINLNDGAVATMLAGTLSQANGGNLNINANSGFIVAPGPGKISYSEDLEFYEGNYTNIAANAWLTVESGTFATRPIMVSGGVFTLWGDTTARVKGEIKGTADASYMQTAGATYLTGGSTLWVHNTALFTGGQLSTLTTTGTDGLTSTMSSTATIKGNLTNTGADVTIGDEDGTFEGHVYGMLLVFGNVNWTGGTYRPVLNGDFNNGHADTWFASGTFTIGGTATIAPVAIDGEGNPIQFPPLESGWKWLVIMSLGGITANNNSPAITGPWVIVPSASKPPLLWYLQST